MTWMMDGTEKQREKSVFQASKIGLSKGIELEKFKAD